MPLKIDRNCVEDKKHSCNVSNVVCQRDLVITGSDDGKIKIWKPDLDFVSEMEAPAGILSIATSDNALYTCCADGNIQTWDLETGKPSAVISTTLYQPQKLFLDKTTQVLWAGDSQGNVAKIQNGKETAKFELVEEIWDLVVAENLMYTGRDRDIVVAEVIEGSQKCRVAIKATHQGRSPLCIAGSYLCFLNREGRNVLVHKNALEEKFPLVKELTGSDLIINAMASSSASVYAGGYDSTVRKWDLNGFRISGSVNLGCCINGLACGAEGEVYVARSDGLVTKIVG